MKKGRRQVVDKNFFQNVDQETSEVATLALPQASNSATLTAQNQYSFNSNSNSHLAPSTTPTLGIESEKSIKKQAGDDTSISPISEQKSKTNKAQQSSEPQEKDEKKSRIQMLKQKYLKKNDPKTKIEQSPQIQLRPEEQKLVSEISVGKRKQVRVEELKGQNRERGVQDRVQTKQQTKEKQQKIPIQDQVQLPEIIKEKEDVQQVQKEMRKPFRVPPPPPKKGSRPPPPPPPISSKQAQQHQSPSKQPEQVSSPSVPLIEVIKARERNQPPPPKKQGGKPNVVQDIISKRLKKEDPFEIKEPNFQLEQPHGEPNHQEASSPMPSSMPLDEEYLDKQIEMKVANVQQSAQISLGSNSDFDIYQGIKIWCTDPDNFFRKILPKEDDFLTILQASSRPDLSLASKNASFSPIISSLLREFVFNSKGELTEGQKQVLSDLSLQYFYSNLNSLTTQFLLVLVKLGSPFLSKYSQFFRKNLNNYCKTVLKYKEYFLSQQLATFVNFLLENIEIQEGVVHLLILIQPSEQLGIFLSSRALEQERSLILSLGASHYVLKTNKQVLGIHFRLINNLIDSIPQEGNMLEGVMKYLNHVQSNEKYYALQKQLKLKLINMISNSPSRQEAPEGGKDPKDQGKGFMGIWNKAIDKFKTATTQFADKEKPTRGPPQTQEPEPAEEEDITYDPVLKRYLINGKVPVDEDHRPNPTGAVKPPPPPPPKTTKPAAPPPPGKKPKTVTASNRYA